MDSAFHFLSLSRKIAESRNARQLSSVMNSIAKFYERKNSYDSTFYYYHLSLYYADLHHNHYQKTRTLVDMGELFFERNKLDSAEFYIDLADTIATKYRFPRFLMENRLILSKIAKSEGNKAAALEYLEQHLELRNSILDFGIIAEINQLQHSYERSKTDQHIEHLTITQAVKDKIIHHQKISNTTMLIVLILIGSLLAFMFVQHRKLNTAYKKLFEKDIKLIEIQGDFPEGHLKKQKKLLPDEMQNELLNRIYSVMEDTSTICNTEFSLEELASLVQSNRVYVSQIINDVLKKNFRTFINEYRISEAQRLFSDPGVSKYTIESIAIQTGFKSRSTFNIAVKEVTGVSPGFYLKSMRGL
jgi:AraC-like DNA-binding protein